jgi:hypothetical protein
MAELPECSAWVSDAPEPSLALEHCGAATRGSESYTTTDRSRCINVIRAVCVNERTRISLLSLLDSACKKDPYRAMQREVLPNT